MGCVPSRRDDVDMPLAQSTTQPVVSKANGSADEQALLREVDISKLVQSGKISEFAASWCDVQAARRMLVATEGDFALAVKKIHLALKWRDQRKSILEGDVPLALEMRGLGHNSKGCAVMYGCLANQVLPVREAVHLSMAEFERIDTLLDLQGNSGQVVFILDCTGFSLWLNMNPGPLVEMAMALDCYFAERISQVIIVDMPRAAKFLWDAVCLVLPPKTRKKFFLVSGDVCYEMVEKSCKEPSRFKSSETYTRVRAAMLLNRDSATTWEERQATWDIGTWKGEELLNGDCPPGCQQLLASARRAEKQRARRNKATDPRQKQLFTRKDPSSKRQSTRFRMPHLLGLLVVFFAIMRISQRTHTSWYSLVSAFPGSGTFLSFVETTLAADTRSRTLDSPFKNTANTKPAAGKHSKVAAA